MSAISKALEIIKPFESCRLKAYLCPAGVPTIGWGATGPDIHLGMVWTQDQADNRLLTDTVRRYRALQRLVKVPVSDSQAGALLSLLYNIGEGNFAFSTLLRRLNDGNYVGASLQFPRWNREHGHVLPGLVRRRAAEKAMFDHG